MVGEIRDKETAQLAIQAALTGHLVFSTLHTNTAIGAIARLVDMGVDPYLIPPVVKLIIAQRLVHRINPNIPAVAVPIDGSVRQILDHEFADLPAEYRAQIKMGGMFYDANPEIKGSMSGRVAVFEMLEMNRELEALILKDPSEPTIYKWAREHGMRNIREDAMIKSSHGIVPWSEVHDL
jgi:type II secretory ATPase GspE/PulE/Tfp pilus assembly ATPase PilB-like protein